MADKVRCPECGAERPDPSRPCEQCGAPSLRPNDKRLNEEEVRDQDLEPYVTLRYIARLFKVLAVLMIVMSQAIPNPYGEATGWIRFGLFLGVVGRPSQRWGAL